MDNVKRTDRIACTLTILLSTFCYIVSRIAGSSQAMLQAILYTLATAVCIFLILSIKGTFETMLSALFSLKLLPPDLSSLESVNIHAFVFYKLASAFSLAVFVFILYKAYKKQEKKEIGAVAVLALLVIIPFFTNTSGTVSSYLEAVTRTRLWSYFSSVAFYFAGLLILLAIANNLKGKSATLICVYEVLALSINIARRTMAIIINAIHSTHISRSYYLWIAMMLFSAVLFLIYAIKLKKEEQINYQS